VKPSAPSEASPPPPPREIAVAARGVIKTFDSFLTRALDDVNFEVRRGEVFGLVGPAGSGKTTLLKLLAGLASPTEGKIKVFGRSPKWGAVKARIGYLPQKKNAGAKDEAEGIFEALGKSLSLLRGRRTKISGEVSAESPRRKDFAQAVLGGRDLILLDEPFAGLDAAGRREIRELIASLSARGKTVIVTGALISDVKNLCDRMAVLFAGKIQATGTLDDLLATPDAIRFTGPVLASATAERVLKIIRDDLQESSANEPAAPAPEAVTKPGDSIRHDKLAGLMKPTAATPAAAAEKGNTALLARKADEKLSALVRKPEPGK
jgi:ABC-2 type transport system ATP-binding protein